MHVRKNLYWLCNVNIHLMENKLKTIEASEELADDNFTARLGYRWIMVGKCIRFHFQFTKSSRMDFSKDWCAFEVSIKIPCALLNFIGHIKLKYKLKISRVQKSKSSEK